MVAEWRDEYGEALNPALNSPGVVSCVRRRPDWQSKTVAPERIYRMIAERDIWRAANLLIREYKADAEMLAARRADEMFERGDREGQLVWLRIRRAVAELQAIPAGKPN